VQVSFQPNFHIQTVSSNVILISILFYENSLKTRTPPAVSERKDGNVGFSHPWGTHDDVFWSIALAVYATADMGPEPFLAVVPRE